MAGSSIQSQRNGCGLLKRTGGCRDCNVGGGGLRIASPPLLLPPLQPARMPCEIDASAITAQAWNLRILLNRVVMPEAFASPGQEFIVTFSRIPPHNRPHGRRGLQRGRMHAHSLALQQPTIRQQAQHPAEHFAMGLHIDQPPGARDRRVIGVDSVREMRTNCRSASESASRQAMPRSLSIPSKYPISSARK